MPEPEPNLHPILAQAEEWGAALALLPIAATMPWIEAMLTIAHCVAPACSIAGIWYRMP